jgi:CRP-like cAMP-binding protein
MTSNLERDVVSSTAAEPALTKPLEPEEFGAALSRFDPVHRRPRTISSQTGNIVLDKLSANDWETVKPDLHRVILRSGQILERTRQRPKDLHFPASAVTTVVARSRNGKRIELGMVGREGVIGSGVVLGYPSAVADTVVRFTGTAWSSDSGDGALPETSRRILTDHLLRSLQSFQLQCAETILFTGHATIEHRLARWLLLASDRCRSLTLPITQDAIAEALGVRRAGITQALHVLESRNLVRSQRRSIAIIDRACLSHEVEGLYLAR